jgi:hypothetical protein
MTAATGQHWLEEAGPVWNVYVVFSPQPLETVIGIVIGLTSWHGYELLREGRSFSVRYCIHRTGPSAVTKIKR